MTKNPTIHSSSPHMSQVNQVNGWCPQDPSLAANAKCGLIFHRNEGFSTASHGILFKAFCYADPAREIIVLVSPEYRLTLLKKHIWVCKGLGGDRGACLHSPAVPRPLQPHRGSLGRPSPASPPAPIFGTLAHFNFLLHNLSPPSLTNSVSNQVSQCLIAMWV